MDQRTKIENIALLLRAAIEAQGRVGLMLNVRRLDLEKVLALLPRFNADDLVSERSRLGRRHTIIEERTVRFRRSSGGGQGIVEYPLNKIVV